MNYHLIVGLLLIPAGIWLVVKGIRFTIKSVSGEILLETNYAQKSADFQVEKEGAYAIWQTWKGSKRNPMDAIVPVIHNQLTGEKITLTHPGATRRTNDFTTSRIEIFSFYAATGKYRVELVDNNSKSLLRSIGFNSTSKPQDLSKVGLQIQESKPAFQMVLSILLILLGAFALITGLVLTFGNLVS